MSKEIRCSKCLCVVAVLESGSKWKAGTVVMCSSCGTKKKDICSGLGDIFGKFGVTDVR